jgi:ABC-type multidrug transport system fused ATPase/permease subunit
MKFNHPILALIPHAKKYRWIFGVSLSLGFVARGLLLFNSQVFSQWVTKLCYLASGSAKCGVLHPAVATWGSREFVGLLFVITGIGFILNTYFRVVLSRSCVRMVGDFYDFVTEHVGKIPMAYFDKTPVGRTVSRFASDYGAIFRMFGGPMGEFFCLFFDLIIILFFMVMMGPSMLPVLAFGVMAQLGLFFSLRGKLRSQREILSQKRTPSISHFAETVQGRVVIRNSPNAGDFVGWFEQGIQDFVQQKIKVNQWVQLFFVGSGAISALTLWMAAGIGFYRSQSGILSVGQLTLALTLLTLVSSVIVQFFEYVSIFQESMVGLGRLQELLEIPQENIGELAHQSPEFKREQQNTSLREIGHSHFSAHRGTQGGDRVTISPAFSIHDLQFSYGNRVLFNGVGFSVHQGEHVGIVGRTGSGKSSLLQALLYLYPWGNGNLSVFGNQVHLPHQNLDSRELEKSYWSVAQWRAEVGTVLQEVVLFQGNLLQNCDPLGKLSRTKVWDLLEQVGFVETLTLAQRQEKLDFFIQERGLNLSVGQRQLLCLARMMVAQQKVLFLDEATSGVDPLSEKIMDQSLKNVLNDRTQILIAHRLSTLERCDRVLWLEEGRIKDFDAPDRVLPRFLSSPSDHFF